jgi:glutamate formiminotransferase
MAWRSQAGRLAAVLECVINISEGRRAEVVDAVAAAGADHVLDVHRDPHHNRSVITVVGEETARAVATAAIERIDLRGHVGTHPRMGSVDVVPFVPLADATMTDAVAARDRFCEWMARVHHVPCFRYGPERSLPEVRRRAFVDLVPDCGPTTPNPRAGVIAAGARPPLVAYNVWLADADLPAARRIAAAIRSPAIRALGFQLGDRVQVSMNLVEPERLGPAAAYDLVAAEAAVAGAELVGLIPANVLERIPVDRWSALDLDESRTIEARLAVAGLTMR